VPELRKDPVTDRWVILVPAREKLSAFPQPDTEEQKAGFCPFCYGSEDKTPAELLAYRRDGCGPNQEGWRVRVVPNRFPALQAEGEVERSGHGLYDKMSGIGAHEVIIEHPSHEQGFATYDDRDVELILWAYRDRYIDLLADTRFKYLLIFRNSGKPAGASIDHPHSQLIATPVVPKRVNEELAGAARYYDYKERCVYCDMIRQEIDNGTRVVEENDAFVALCPFASRFPYELVIAPKQHQSDFAAITETELRLCAQLLRRTMARLLEALDNPPFNYMLHTAPTDARKLDHYHWHIEVVPRLTRMAGFEFGSGFYANPIPPEEAASRLNEVELAPHSVPKKGA